jgi:hypothetical protein
MGSPERMLILFLRGTAIMLVCAAGAVVMPHAWMAAHYERLGLGSLPDLPLVGYLTRSVSALYATMGVTYWFLSCDVQRYLPFLRFTVPVTLLLDVTLIAIDVAVDLPLWWAVVEGAFILSWTLVLWLLVRRVGPAAIP